MTTRSGATDVNKLHKRIFATSGMYGIIEGGILKGTRWVIKEFLIMTKSTIKLHLRFVLFFITSTLCQLISFKDCVIVVNFSLVLKYSGPCSNFIFFRSLVMHGLLLW